MDPKPQTNKPAAPAVAKPNPAIIAGAATSAAAQAAPSTQGAAAPQGASAAKEKKETVIETVTMNDGRLVEFPGKRRLQKESLIDTATGQVSVRMDFRNGETRTFAVPSNLLSKFAAHGAEQKLGDEISGVTDIDDAVEAVDKLTGRLAKGEWTQTGDGTAVAGESILLKAIAEVTGADKDKIRDFLKDKTPAQKQALRVSADFGAVVKRMEAEKAAKKPAVDVSADIAALKGMAKAA